MSGNEAVIVQLCLPHYRVPFFAELTQRMSGSVTIIAGQDSFGGSPVSVPNTSELNRIDVRNAYLANQIAVQPLPRLAFESSIAVLQFDPRILSNLRLFWWRKWSKRPVIWWGHGLSRRRSSPAWVLRLRRWLAHHADALIFYDERGREEFLRLGLPQGKLFVADNAIDVARIRPLSLKYSGERKNVLFIGRLIPSKKADLLVEGFARARALLPIDTRLVIVGDGPERGRLASLIRVHQISEAVDLVGGVTDDVELAPLFAQSAVCVSPGYVGLSAIHSLAYGVPLLVADTEPHSPEIEVLLPGETGEYFAANNADALANRLVELLAHPQRLAIMGDSGRNLVQEKYSVQHMADVFLQAFDYVIARIS
jgi:glycosyltransferase involved in cell wall biosynthesis